MLPAADTGRARAHYLFLGLFLGAQPVCGAQQADVLITNDGAGTEIRLA